MLMPYSFCICINVLLTLLFAAFLSNEYLLDNIVKTAFAHVLIIRNKTGDFIEILLTYLKYSNSVFLKFWENIYVYKTFNLMLKKVNIPMICVSILLKVISNTTLYRTVQLTLVSWMHPRLLTK